MLKNWFRSFYILLCAAGAALYLTLFALLPSGESISFALACFILAPVAFFIGTIIYNTLKYFKKGDVAASYTQLATGAIATLLFSIGAGALFSANGAFNIVASSDIASSEMARWYAQVLVTFAFLAQLIIFGLMPLLKGISKTFAVTNLECVQCEVEAPKRTRKPRAPKPAATQEEAPVTPAE